MFTSVLLASGVGCRPAAEDQIVESTKADEADVIDGPIEIVATVEIVADLLKEIGGNRVRVTSLHGNNTDIFLYQPSQDDIDRLAGVDVLFYVARSVDRWVQMYELTQIHRPKVASIMEYMDATHLGVGMDPFVWMNPLVLDKTLDSIVRVLIEVDPEGEPLFRKNASIYRDRLSRMYEYGKQCLATVPPGNRTLATSTEVFYHFGDAYRLTTVGVRKPRFSAEPQSEELDKFVDLLIKHDATTVFKVA